MNQTLWTLDGFTINDPLTGRFDIQLSVEAAQSVTLSSGRYSAEFGKGSAGVLAVETKMGSDVFRHSATNFVPGLETRKGSLTLGQWRNRNRARRRILPQGPRDSQRSPAAVAGRGAR